LEDKIKEKFNTDFDEIFDYFEDTYIGRYGRNASRSRPIFAINLWNIFNQTDEGLPRTNNNVERWHCQFSSQVASCHPILWKFLEFLKKEENLIVSTSFYSLQVILHLFKEDDIAIVINEF
ncbi:Uncharacterized protein FKW44_011752, partial [Caligus rogercresseyi]